MASITRANGPSDWRAAFGAHPGLAVTPENWELLTAAPDPAPEPEPVAEPDPEPEPAAEPADAPEPARRTRSTLA